MNFFLPCIIIGIGIMLIAISFSHGLTEIEFYLIFFLGLAFALVGGVLWDKSEIISGETIKS